ncbi:M23 family metallopeptidase [Streptomyces sp. SAJ15]|uniref:M23 family metallopeptidase n=1 Tax=Streptomyces sp. SAJ15 TaxID=2011095 RepID=UPI0011848AD2|nr:M23 family metallopeptidase [Streptomyces sp. SAJ15]TVL90217.1 peptidase M23 [Streptomyces sp. SAJ15]
MNDRHPSGSSIPTVPAPDASYTPHYGGYEEQQGSTHSYAAYDGYVTGTDVYSTGSFDQLAGYDTGAYSGYDAHGTGSYDTGGQYDATQWAAGSSDATQHWDSGAYDTSALWSGADYQPVADASGQAGIPAQHGAVDTSGSWDSGGWDTGSWDAADASGGWDGGTWEAAAAPGGYDAHATGSYDTGGSHDTGSHGTGSYDTGASYDTGHWNTGTGTDTGLTQTWDAALWAQDGEQPRHDPAPEGDSTAAEAAAHADDAPRPDPELHGDPDDAEPVLVAPHADADAASHADAPRRESARRDGARARRRTAAARPKRSALLTVAVPSVAIMGVTAVAAAAVSGIGSGSKEESKTTQAAKDAPPVKASVANSKLDTQLAGVTRNADDFANRASRTQERIDLKERQEAERKRAAEEAARKERLRPKFALPVAQHGLSAGYGQAGINWMSVHTGIDFPVSYGTPVMAATDGTVRTQWNNAYGNMAIVTSPDGTETWYCHLSTTKIRSGSVKAGDVIAYSGNSGNSTGPHLHFEVRPGSGSAIDPVPWLRSHGLDPM